MGVFIHVAFFLLGVVTTLGVLMILGWVLAMRERVKQAEEARRQMEDAIKAVEEEQKKAADMLQNSITELIKRRQATQQVAAPPAPQVTDPNITSSIKERLRKAAELTLKQGKLDPKKGPEFQMQHNELELEKLAVLKTILAEGFDPVITIRYNTGDQEMLLSAYVQSISKGLA